MLARTGAQVQPKTGKAFHLPRVRVMTPSPGVQPELRPQGQLDQVSFQLPFSLAVSTWGQTVALRCPGWPCVLFSFSNHKWKKNRKKKNHILLKQPRWEILRAAAAAFRDRGEDGLAGGCRGRRTCPVGAKARRPKARALPGRAVAAASPAAAELRSWPAPRGARCPAHGPAGPAGGSPPPGRRPIVRWRRRPGARGPEGSGTRK